MIPEYKYYHGCVLANICDEYNGTLIIRTVKYGGRMLNYVINETVAFQVKHATQRLRPWSFTFLPGHILSLAQLRSQYTATFLVLVCERDGVIAAHVDDILPALSKKTGEQAWLRADRKRREMYRLYSPAGELSARFKTSIHPIIEALIDHDTAEC